jgi:hypothetical protein
MLPTLHLVARTLIESQDQIADQAHCGTQQWQFVDLVLARERSRRRTLPSAPAAAD